MVKLDETTLYTGMAYGMLILEKNKFVVLSFDLVKFSPSTDKTRENYRDAICSVMTQLLRMCLPFFKYYFALAMC